jgi:signal transduction histidine kinase
MGIQRRRAINILIEPALQLKLPLMIMIITLVFAAFQMWHTHYAFNQIFEAMYREAGKSQSLDDLIRAQVSTFVEVSAVIAILYLVVVTAFSLAYVHRMIGPMVGVRRHVEALKNGDYGSRVRFRKGDAFDLIKGDLNELAELLENEVKKSEPSSLPPR